MEFVIVQRFKNYIETNIVKGMLEANGIFCWLQDEYSSVIWKYPVGGIKLMVRQDEAQQALDLMNHNGQSRSDFPS